MTSARPLRHPAPKQGGMRVLRGRKQLRRPALAPWMMMVLIGVAAFLGLGFARTSLDRSAFELDRLDRAIAEQEAINEQLRLEIGVWEEPCRLTAGLMIPGNTRQLLVDLGGPAVASVDEGDTQ